MRWVWVIMGATLILATGAGFLTAVAISGSAQDPSRTVTVNVATGPTGPEGPAGERGPPGARGPTGEQGPPGDFSCLIGFSPGILLINHPGGQVRIYTCIED